MKTTTMKPVLLVVASLLLGACSRKQTLPSSVPVVLGGSQVLDACTSLGVTRQETTVRSGPGALFAPQATLKAKRSVHLCETSENGVWISIVYSADETQDCEVSTPIRKRKAYSGPCDTGWIHVETVTVVAG